MLIIIRGLPGSGKSTLAESLEGVEHLILTTGHPEFGIECTITIGDDYATVINQPDELTAIIAARRELDYQKIVDDGLKKIGEYNSQFFRKDDEGDE
jgi:broad-specificity NMP kinase